MNPNINTKKELNQEDLKKNKKNTIQRANHSRNFFVMNRLAAQDKNLSLQATGLLAYLLSLPGDWKIYKTQLYKNKSNGREATINAFNELMEQKYILGIQQYSGNLRTGFKYYVFEIPYDEDSDEFKKFLRETENPFPEIKVPENTVLQNTYKENTHIQNIQKEVASEDAPFLSKYLFSKLREKNPKYKEPNLDQWAKEVELMMKMDKRTKEEILSVLDWAFKQMDDFWPTAIQSPKTLRKLFDSAWLKKNHSMQKESTKEEFRAKNIRWLKDKINQLTWNNMRGNLSYNKEEAYDSILNVRTPLDSLKMIDIVKGWDKMRRKI